MHIDDPLLFFFSLYLSGGYNQHRCSLAVSLQAAAAVEQPLRSLRRRRRRLEAAAVIMDGESQLPDR